MTRNIHAPGAIRTRVPSKRAAAEPRLRPRGHLGSTLSCACKTKLLRVQTFWQVSWVSTKTKKNECRGVARKGGTNGAAAPRQLVRKEKQIGRQNKYLKCKQLQHTKKFKLLSPIQGNSINKYGFLMFVISVRGSSCDYSFTEWTKYHLINDAGIRVNRTLVILKAWLFLSHTCS